MKKLTLFIFLILNGCGAKKGLQPFEWKRGQSPKSLQALDSIQTTGSQDIRSLSETVQLQTQTFQGIEIENSFVKYLRDKDGQEIVVRAAITMDEERLKNLLLSEVEHRRSTIGGVLKSVFPSFRKNPPEKIDLRIVSNNGFYEPVWSVLYVDKKGIPWEAQISTHLQIRSVKRVSSQFHDTPAFVFPRGPKVSSLAQVMLRNLATSPTLSNGQILVTSQAEHKITNVEDPLKYGPTDSRFDQVQVFYYLNESLLWIDKNLNFRLPFKLSAEVFVGYPQKTNAAFYYQGKIRLGSGDDEVYSHIAQDPSIVIHESIHALVETVARLPYEGEGGSLNEAFADFFTALQLDNPNMGEVAYLKGPFRRSLVNDLKLSDKNEGLYHDSGIFSGALWDLRMQFGHKKASDIAILILNRLTPASDFADFQSQIRAVLPLTLTEKEQQEALQNLSKRGL